MYPCSFKCLKSVAVLACVWLQPFLFFVFYFSLVLKTMAIFLNFVVKTALIWLVLGGFFCVFSQSETICNLHSCYKFALVLQKNCTPFSANQNWVIFSCILSSLLSYSEIHGVAVICNNRFSVIIFNFCICCILSLTIDYCIKAVLTKWFLFVCAGFLVNALHECCIVFISKLLIFFRL